MDKECKQNGLLFFFWEDMVRFVIPIEEKKNFTYDYE
jgi:hypothetical protein